MSKAGLLGTVALVSLVVYACSGPDDAPTTDTAATSASPAVVAPARVAPEAGTGSSPTSTARPATPEPGSGYGVGPELVTVTSVTDGDTFRVGDRRIRVIGIDSCEADTTGGTAATTRARELLLEAPVTLSSEPGVDRDRYGREVRYVQVPGGDFGRLMVPADHTGVYGGGDNASADYLAGLRALDAGGSSCGTSTAGPTTSARPLQAAPRTSAPEPEAPRPVAQQPAAPSGGGAYYKNCTAARAAGAAPLYRGQPGYAPKLDRDGDGVACE